MRKSLRQPIENLRDGLRAALASTLLNDAPSSLRTQLARSVLLLDEFLLAQGAAGQAPAVASQLALWAHGALSEAGFALATWQLWMEEGRLVAA